MIKLTDTPQRHLCVCCVMLDKCDVFHLNKHLNNEAKNIVVAWYSQLMIIPSSDSRCWTFSTYLFGMLSLYCPSPCAWMPPQCVLSVRWWRKAYWVLSPLQTLTHTVMAAPPAGHATFTPPGESAGEISLGISLLLSCLMCPNHCPVCIVAHSLYMYSATFPGFLSSFCVTAAPPFKAVYMSDVSLQKLLEFGIYPSFYIL